MGAFVLEHGISRRELAHSLHEGLIIALAEAVYLAPRAGDVEDLLLAGRSVQRLHVAYHVLRALGQLLEHERLTEVERTEVTALAARYARLAIERHDVPLEALAATTVRRIKNLA